MSEMKTREEAVKEVDQEMLGSIKRGGQIICYTAGPSSVGYNYRDTDGVHTVTVTFTPPKPQYAIDTIGMFDDGGHSGVTPQLGFFKRYNRDGTVKGSSYKDKRTLTLWRNFTPIYQNDPALDLAYENRIEEFCSREDLRDSCNHCPLRDNKGCTNHKSNVKMLKAYYLIQAKEELSKDKADKADNSNDC